MDPANRRERGGHEVNLAMWTKLAPEALDTVVETTTDLLSQVFGGTK